MSLKSFHIFFVIVSTLFTLGFGIWSLDTYFKGAVDGTPLILGISSLAIGAILIIYGIKVYHKLKDL